MCADGICGAQTHATHFVQCVSSHSKHSFGCWPGEHTHTHTHCSSFRPPARMYDHYYLASAGRRLYPCVSVRVCVCVCFCKFCGTVLANIELNIVLVRFDRACATSGQNIAGREWGGSLVGTTSGTKRRVRTACSANVPMTAEWNRQTRGVRVPCCVYVFSLSI